MPKVTLRHEKLTKKRRDRVKKRDAKAPDPGDVTVTVSSRKAKILERSGWTPVETKATAASNKSEGS